MCARVLSDLYQIVVVFILVCSMRHEASYRCMYTHTDYLSWSRNAAICARIAATVRIFDTCGVDPLPSVGSQSLITGVCVCGGVCVPGCMECKSGRVVVDD